ncbi:MULTISPECIES: aspartate/glutamate racemase family protein [Pseudarthrobacter]|uniref:aspartate/glutamate racemase family protein n=1 Tax=Pseudarthrobacter TaxID=1742993 RepID=UPI00203DC75E|nr:aspartate/glutamate racemase family protein [Pseudarthrobacter sp. NCCP-2145]MBA4101268.1 hydantoin racemase [Arthrobacter sp.]GKV71900.1 hydantoin racemase [Pseudarthrobacter sp. NCCP-2145]
MATESSAQAKVLLINPNSNSRTTQLMTDIAAGILEPEGLEVVGLTAAGGPAMIIDPDSLAESAQHVHDAVHDYMRGPDGTTVKAVIVAAIGDPGRSALAESLDIPVIGIGQASIQSACGEGRRFGMATSTPLLAGSLSALVKRHGRSRWFTGVRLTRSEPLVLASDPEQQYLELAEAVSEASHNDGAEAVIIAGGPLSETARRLALTGMAEIIQPVPSACAKVLQELSTTPQTATQ